jgi:2'-5' RNA ligase
MRRLFTVAFPEWAAADAAFVDGFRRRHDEAMHSVVGPHVTLLFGCSALPAPDYRAHVERVAASSPTLSVRFRYAMLGADDEQPLAYVFLVPDDGNAGLSLLHDRLYTGPMAAQLRLDLPYTPHVTIGRSADRLQAKRWCDQLNEAGVDIEARISTLTVGGIDAGRFVRLADYPLNLATH